MNVFSVFLAILSGLATVGNYMLYENKITGYVVNLIIQAILIAVSVMAAIMYKGYKTRYGYEGYRVFNFSFGIIFISIIATIGTFVGIFLYK